MANMFNMALLQVPFPVQPLLTIIVVMLLISHKMYTIVIIQVLFNHITLNTILPQVMHLINTIQMPLIISTIQTILLPVPTTTVAHEQQE